MLLVGAIACQRRRLRDAERLGHELTPRLRRRFGFGRKVVSDTTLYEMLRRTVPLGFREALFGQVRTDLDRKAIVNDRFAGGVVSYDGKCAGWQWGEPPNQQCKRLWFRKAGKVAWRLNTLRCALTSSSAKPVLDQEIFGPGRGEATAFAPIFLRDVAQFPRLFRYVTADAGITTKTNAELVVSRSKHYVFALKTNAGKLYDTAKALVEEEQISAQTVDRERGETVQRTLCRYPLSWNSGVDFPGAAQILKVTRQRASSDGTVKTKVRYYITSIPYAELSPKALLKLVRLHWEVENGPHWTADVVLDEDSHCPCYKGHGVVVMSWLNVLAYNLIAVFRAHLPKKSGRRPPWREVNESVYEVLSRWEPALSIEA
jgi:predicted transposase YbfD/YdcC